MISRTVLQHLLHNPEFRLQVFPFLKDEYFSGGEKVIFEIIREYVQTYNDFPSVESVGIDLSNRKISNEIFELGKETLVEVADDPDANTSTDWLLDTTEKFCQERAIDNALGQCLQIKSGQHKTLDKGAIPKLLEDALAVSFDVNLGHDYFDDVRRQWEYYHNDKKRIPFKIKKLNEITKGGVTEKTLNMIMAPTGVGKSLVLCSLAADHLALGYNVIYYTMEMSEEEIRKRIDANLLSIPMDDLDHVEWEDYETKIGSIRSKTHGTLIVKEYASGSANIDHFQHFLNELKMKKSVVPHVVYIDYLNICSSNRVKMDVGSYGFVRSIAGELRSFGQRNRLPIFSATQSNRGGYDSTELDMSNLSESFGTGFEVDMLLAMYQTEELAEVKQYGFNYLKSRYVDNRHPDFSHFHLGVNKPLMRIGDLDVGDNANDPFKIRRQERLGLTLHKKEMTFDNFK